MSHTNTQAIAGVDPVTWTFRYTNYRGETSKRCVRFFCLWYGTSPYHEGEQWFLKGNDQTENKVRDFAMKDMLDVFSG